MFAVPLIAVAWIVTFRICVRRKTRFLRIKLAEQVALREHSESASKVKGEFLANMSHEIRTPMNAILGFTDLVLKTQLSSELREDLDSVRTSAKWLMHIVNDVLEFSRMEAGGGLQLDSKEFSFAECIRSTIGIIQREAAARI